MKRIEDMNREEMTKTENEGDFLFLHSVFSIPDVCANFIYSVSNIQFKIQKSCILLNGILSKQEAKTKVTHNS